MNDGELESTMLPQALNHNGAGTALTVWYKKATHSSCAFYHVKSNMQGCSG
jgi:hypothetical protein